MARMKSKQDYLNEADLRNLLKDYWGSLESEGEEPHTKLD